MDFSDYRSDRRLFLDDVDIKFSRTLNSCKVPQVYMSTTLVLTKDLLFQKCVRISSKFLTNKLNVMKSEMLKT